MNFNIIKIATEIWQKKRILKEPFTYLNYRRHFLNFYCDFNYCSIKLVCKNNSIDIEIIKIWIKLRKLYLHKQCTNYVICDVYLKIIFRIYDKKY